MGEPASSSLPADTPELIRLFQQSDLLELSIEQGGRKLFLRKDGGLPGQIAPEREEAAAAPPSVIAVKAHMVGRFYWTRDKQARASVSLEQEVARGQVIGYVEAMGIMNELEATGAGRVVEIAAASGQPVEYGQTVLVLQPDER